MNLEFTGGGNIATTSGLLTGTGAETVYDTTATINFVIDGLVYQKTAVTDGVTPTTDIAKGGAITLTANKSRAVLWLMNAAGTVAVTAGDIVDWSGGTTAPEFGYGANGPNIPAVPEGYAAFAVSLIKAGSTTSGTWTFGSSNWNAAGINAKHRNIALGLPSRPILNMA